MKMMTGVAIASHQANVSIELARRKRDGIKAMLRVNRERVERVANSICALDESLRPENFEMPARLDLEDWRIELKRLQEESLRLGRPSNLRALETYLKQGVELLEKRALIEKELFEAEQEITKARDSRPKPTRKQHRKEKRLTICFKGATGARDGKKGQQGKKGGGKK